MSIHPTALIDSGASLHESVEVGPYCIVGPDVEIGAGSRLISHVVVQNTCRIGKGNVFHPFSSVGGMPQDLKYDGEPARLVMGDNNQVREGATLNVGTEHGGMETVVGSNCLMMAYSHVAHDCRLGDGVVLANSVGLAGHVELGDGVIVGGLAGIHQFCRVGRNAFIAAGAMVAQDVVPFGLVQGDRARHVGINVVGLKRSGWSSQDVQAVRRAFKGIFYSSLGRAAALDKVEADQGSEHPVVAEMCAFIRSAERGTCPARGAPCAGEDH